MVHHPNDRFRNFVFKSASIHITALFCTCLHVRLRRLRRLGGRSLAATRAGRHDVRGPRVRRGRGGAAVAERRAPSTAAASQWT